MKPKGPEWVVSLWTQSLRVQQEHVKPEWVSGLWFPSFSLTSSSVCMCVLHSHICLSVYYIRIVLEASENEITCCHLLEKSFGIICELQLPLLLLLQFLWLIESWPHVIFIFVEENWCFLLPAQHTGLVISILQCKNPIGWWWHSWIVPTWARGCTELVLLILSLGGCLLRRGPGQDLLPTLPSLWVRSYNPSHCETFIPKWSGGQRGKKRK